LAGLGCLLATAGRLAAQDSPHQLDYEAFNANATVARWMMVYDRVAWVTTDLVVQLPRETQAQLGNEWFAYERDGHWHAVYGRYDPAADRYHAVVHYVRADTGFRRTPEPPDSLDALAFGRALHLTGNWRHGKNAPPVRFNQFVRRLPDGRIEVWYLPAWQPNGCIAHGIEVQYTLSPDGFVVVDSAWRGSRLALIAPDRNRYEVLDEHEATVPSVGSLFLVMAYGTAFRQLYIETRDVRTTLFRDGSKVAWISAVRPKTGEASP
ncbi:MAG TPA: hypothetical protein VFS11_05245, partial [Gemmatimonadales bacterium]|nr:hypothetical protein [Gemmatimonadales bacterium]